MPPVWNKYQDEIFNFIANSDRHGIVRARAGTGKTTTIIEALSYRDPNLRALLCAFNKSIETELKSRAPEGVIVKTLHAIGLATLRRRYNNVTVDGERTRRIVQKFCTPKGGKLNFERSVKVGRLVSFAKNTLAAEHTELLDIVHALSLDDEEHPDSVLAELARSVLEECAEEPASVIDFDDMLWLPVIHGIRPQTYDLVFVDEAQDLNAAQSWLVESMIEGGGRLIAVGDDRQAIYGWRGAGANVLRNLQEQFGAELLPLSITYRCPKKVVALARKIVPDFECPDTAPEGEVRSVDRDELIQKAERKDFVLSRTNAPLMRVCLDLLARGMPAKITGRDIGKALLTLAKKSKQETIPGLLTWIPNFLQSESVRLAQQEAQFAKVQDSCLALQTLCEGLDTVRDLEERITGLFSDDDLKGVVTCSTVHRAKGLERDRVWLLTETFRPGQSREEDNIYYVGITRARASLFLVR